MMANHSVNNTHNLSGLTQPKPSNDDSSQENMQTD
jgi:hypothetical protein